VNALLQVVRKDDRESLENLIRRFNKKVQQSGVLGVARRKKFFEKPLSKREQREIAIRKRVRKEIKAKQYLGIR
jgi:ribosomal protein S21